MRVIFWGTRGSLPTPLNARQVREKLEQSLRAALEQGINDPRQVPEFMDRHLDFATRGTYGGNTACVQVQAGDRSLILDAGSGLRELGLEAIQQRPVDDPGEYHILLSHLHWDHIMGLPFFPPAYHPAATIHFYACHRRLEAALHNQQRPPHFPVRFGSMAARKTFTLLKPGREYNIAGFTVRPMRQNHPQLSYGYRIEDDGKSMVYSTDAEHKSQFLDDDYPFVEFFRRADLLIFDAQYTFSEAVTHKENWGHSSNMVGVELACRAQVEHLCLFHHDPTNQDQALLLLEENTRRLAKVHGKMAGSPYPHRVSLAYDGLVLEP